MRAYSSYDLIGKQIGISNYQATDRILLWINKLFPQSIVLTFKIEIPVLVYLRTESIIEQLNQKIVKPKMRYNKGNIVGILYLHFIQKAFNNKNGFKHAFDVLVKANAGLNLPESSNFIIEDQTSNDGPFYYDKIYLPEKYVRKGELLLLQLDQQYGHNFTVDNMLQSIWSAFFMERITTSDSKIIDEVGDIIENL